MNCRLSVITPVFNGIRFIEFCIRNVIEQNCPDIEHIIIDGGSTDGTVEVIGRYAAEYTHIRWISEKDRGQSDAMNKGIDLASGELLGILNADDYYQSGSLSEVIEMFRSLSSPTVLIGNCNVWDDNGNFLYLNRPVRVGLPAFLILYVPAFPANPSAYFYHRTLHEKIGPYKIDDHYVMDIDFIFRAFHAAQVKYVNKLWGNYRFYAGTKTFDDVTGGLNRVRVTEIAEIYRKQSPLHYRLISLLFIRLVNVYKAVRKKGIPCIPSATP